MSRLLKISELANVFETSEAEAEKFYRLAENAFPQIAGNLTTADMLRQLVNSQAARLNTVCDAAGVPAYALCYGFTRHNWLFVHGVLALNRSDFSLAEKAITEIARANDCPVIQCNTLRKGLFKHLTDTGDWQPLGVVMVKNLCHSAQTKLSPDR